MSVLLNAIYIMQAALRYSCRLVDTFYYVNSFYHVDIIYQLNYIYQVEENKL